ncbi:MDR family MFS transporter [Lentilactobacillus senioris]|uniref:MDR family MFS transporter n=1 Tax=Lentilactobacillus senioris TaxID=931534 RepID=UPI0006D076A9|nr:MDR family MFS transporter [Lentilactobacillus senioris]
MAEKQQTLDANGKPYNRTMMMVAIILGLFMSVLSSTMLATAYPTLMDSFDVSTSTVQWLTTGYMMVNGGVMIPISAWLISRFGSGALFNTAMFFFLGGSILAWTATSFGMLFAARVIQAVGAGIAMPVAQTVLLSIYPPDRRGGAVMGMMGLAIGLAPAIGPTLSGWLIDNYNWRALFSTLIPFTILALVVGLIFNKKVLATKKSNLDWISAAESTLGFGLLLYGFSQVGDNGWGGDPTVIAPILIGVIAIAIFVYRQLHLENPFLELRVFKTRDFTISAILSSDVNMAMVGVEMVLPIYLQTIRGDSALESGLTLLPGGALMIGIASPITGRLFDKYGGAKHLATAGMILLTLGTIPFLFLTKETPLLFIIVTYCIRMLGVGMVMMPTSTAGMNALPTNMISHGTAVNNTARQVASSVGTAILISILTNVTKDDMPAKHVLHNNPLVYKEGAQNAVLNGYSAAFSIAVLFCLVGWGLSYLLKQKQTVGGDK